MPGGWNLSCRARALACALALGLAQAAPLAAAQFGMVVGVDDYRHFGPFPAPPGEMFDLEGAVNDAERIAGAMRRMGIDLPDSRFLLNERATVDGFLAAWAEMTARAAPGDTLIVTFSGHGGQERETSEPFDEVTDGLDETIMLHDFDPANPRVGRLSDDQLRQLLSEASAFNVIWVMDSCHSAGLTRSANAAAQGITRNGGIWDIPIEPLVTEIAATAGDDAEALPHVTQILATASEDRLVTETRFEGKPHGALSWYFAEALTGAADTDGNGVVTRSEMAGYLQDRVFTHMNQNQQPRILPRGDAREVLALGAGTVLPGLAPPQGPQPVPVAFTGAPPPGLTPGSYVQVTTSPALSFEQGVAGWTAYNHTGDRITTLRDGADRLIARTQALLALNAAKHADLPPVGIAAQHGFATQAIGSIVSFRFDPPAPDMAHATLFNIASDGTLQLLHPVRAADDVPVGPQGLPARFRVTPPAGADQLVAVFCDRPPLDLRALLAALNGQTVPADGRLTEALKQGRCQTGTLGLFTEE